MTQTTFDLSVKNPNRGEEVVHRSPEEIMDEIAALDSESEEVLANHPRHCYEERVGRTNRLTPSGEVLDYKGRKQSILLKGIPCQEFSYIDVSSGVLDQRRTFPDSRKLLTLSR